MSAMRRLTNLLLALLLATSLVPAVADAQTQTGTVEGKITDPQGGVLPGVTVTLTGARGVQTTVSEASGDFRFVGLQPDTYGLKAELAGFLTQQVDAVVVGLAKTVTVDLSLKLGGVTENVDVRAAASTVDVRGASTDTNLSNDLLTLMPIYSATSTGLLNYAPGINNSSAYGSQGSYGNALLLDGVDTRDPEGGSAWTFFNQNLIQEVQIGGLGAPAEFGGFTGAIINTVTKSGGNAYSGLFTMRYTRDSFAGDNISSSVLSANPTLGQAAVTKKLTDYTVQLGGPLKQDKAFFFASVQRYSTKTDPTGPVANSTDISPRFNVKFTFQPSPTDTVIAGVQYRLVQRHGPGLFFLASLAGNRSPDCRRGCPRVGVELPMEENLRRERLPGSQVHRLRRLLQSGSGRPESVLVRRADGRVLLRRRRRALLQRSEPQPGTGRADEVRGEVRQALAQVRPRDGAQPRAEYGQPYGAIELLHVHLWRCLVYRSQLQLVSRPTTNARPHSRRMSGQPGS